ncbi:MAG: hypothetical protein ABI970_04575 [Chloroflexota bacterium]|nr:hypothetical protein [Anaerolineae bacterium]
MNANLMHTHLTRPRQNRDTQIAVVPSSVKYLGQMELCHQLAYGYTADDAASDSEALTAAKFRQHLAIFPAGQFIGVDKTTDRVVGLTVSMRVDLKAHDAAKSWAELTNDG